MDEAHTAAYFELKIPGFFILIFIRKIPERSSEKQFSDDLFDR